SVQAPAFSELRFRVLAPFRLIKTFVLSQMKSLTIPLTAVPPVLQTRAPISNVSGPVAGLLLSRPMTFHETGVTVSPAYALCTPHTPKNSTRRKTRRATIFKLTRDNSEGLDIIRKFFHSCELLFLFNATSIIS